MNPVMSLVQRIRARFHFRRAERLQQIGELQRALEVYREIAPHFDGHMRAGILNRAGMIAYDLGDLEVARDFYREAITFEPGEPALHMNLGNALHRLGDRNGARDAYDRALGLSRRDDVLYNVAGFIGEEDVPAAIGLLRECLLGAAEREVTIPAEAPMSMLAQLAEFGNREEVDHVFTELASRAPSGISSWSVANWHGIMLSRAGRQEEALVKFREVLEAPSDVPEVTDVHYNIGRAMMRMERWDEAIAEFRRVPHAMSNYGLGCVHEARGEHELAAEQYRLYLADVEATPAHERRHRGWDPGEGEIAHAHEFLGRERG